MSGLRRSGSRQSRRSPHECSGSQDGQLRNRQYALPSLRTRRPWSGRSAPTRALAGARYGLRVDVMLGPGLTISGLAGKGVASPRDTQVGVTRAPTLGCGSGAQPP